MTKTTAELEATAPQDADTDDDEFTLGFGVLPEAVTAGTPSEATVLIVDDDLMPLTVQFGAASYTVAEGGMVTVTATISPAADRDVSVPLTASPAGFVPGDVTLLFASGETTVELEVNAPQDDDTEDEEFTLGFGALPEAVTAGTPSQTTVRIADDDRAVAERIEQLNEALLGRQALQIMDDVNYAVSSRVRALDGPVSSATASSPTATFGRLSGPSSGTSLGTSSPAPSGTAPGISYASSGGMGLANLWPGRAQTFGSTGSFDWTRLLDGASFAMPLIGAGSDCSGAQCNMTLWGSGSFHSLAGGDGLTWDGEMVGGLVGVDARFANVLAGISASVSQGSFDYTDSADGGTGEYESNMTSIHPYLGWSSGNGARLWGSAGFGGGDIEIAEAGRALETSDTALQAFSVGASGAFRSTDDGNGSRVEWNMVSEATMTKVELDGGGLIGADTVDGSRMHVAIERRGERALDGGGSFASTLEVGARRDAGFEYEAGSGTGAEVGVGLEWQRGRVAFGARARGLVGGESDEWGANMLLSVGAGCDGQGLSLTLRPSYGVAQSGVQQLWDRGVNRLAWAGGSAQAAPVSFRTMRTNLEIGYGIRRNAGLFTPFGEVESRGPSDAYRAGIRMQLDSGWRIDFLGEHRVGLAERDNALSLTLQWSGDSTTPPHLHQREPTAGSECRPDHRP